MWVAPGGAVAFEIGNEDQAGIELPEFGRWHVCNDQTNRPRVLWARR
jgi:hypothetical protein